MEPLHDARSASTQLRRQRGQDFEACRRHHGSQPELGRWAWQTTEEERLRLLGRHAGQPRTVPIHEPHAAGWPTLRVDRHAGGGERVDIAEDRPLGHLELASELRSRQLSAGLQQQEQRHESGCTHVRKSTPYSCHVLSSTLPIMSRMIDGLRIRPANEASWEELQAVFGTRGSGALCQCQRYKLLPKESFGSFPAEERALRLREQTNCDDPPAESTSGLVAYLDGEPVGWCAVEPGPPTSASRACFACLGRDAMRTGPMTASGR